MRTLEDAMAEAKVLQKESEVLWEKRERLRIELQDLAAQKIIDTGLLSTSVWDVGIGSHALITARGRKNDLHDKLIDLIPGADYHCSLPLVCGEAYKNGDGSFSGHRHEILVLHLDDGEVSLRSESWKDMATYIKKWKIRVEPTTLVMVIRRKKEVLEEAKEELSAAEGMKDMLTKERLVHKDFSWSDLVPQKK